MQPADIQPPGAGSREWVGQDNADESLCLEAADAPSYKELSTRVTFLQDELNFFKAKVLKLKVKTWKADLDESKQRLKTFAAGVVSGGANVLKGLS